MSSLSPAPSSGQSKQQLSYCSGSLITPVTVIRWGITLSTMKTTFDVKEEIINTSSASDWAGCEGGCGCVCGCGEGGPGIPGMLGTTVTGLTS